MMRAKPHLRPKEFDFTYQAHHFAPGIQIVSIYKDKAIFLYRVQEIFCDPEFHGRGFRLDRVRDDLEPDSDSPHEATHYNVIVGEHPIYHRCDCPGFLQFSYCKHVIVMDDVLIDEKEYNAAQHP